MPPPVQQKWPEGQHPGRLIHHFPRRKNDIKRWLSLGVGLSLVLFSVVISGMTLFNSWDMVNHHGRAILLNSLPVPVILVTIALPSGFLLISLTIGNWQKGISLRSNGLVLHRGKKRKILFWEKIIRLDTNMLTVKLAGHPFRKRTQITLEDESGQVFIIKDRYEGMDQLAQMVREKLLPLLFARATKTIQKNKTLFFHPRLLGKAEGLLIRQHMFPWQAIKGPIIQNDKLIIKQRGTQKILFQEKTTRIRNLDLLRHLLSTHHCN